MSTSLALRFERDGATFRVTGFSSRGVLFDGEDPVRPRQFGFQFGWPSDSTAHGRIARERIRQFQRQNGLEWNELPIALRRQGERIVASGSAGLDLPPTHLWCRLRVEDLKVHHPYRQFKLQEDEEVERVFEVEDSIPPIGIVEPPGGFDAKVRRVLTAPGSVADSVALEDFVVDAAYRSNRRACLLNLLAKLRSIACNGTPLIDHVRRVYRVDSDRIHAHVDRQLLVAARQLAGSAERRFFPETRTHSEVHDLVATRPPEDLQDDFPPYVLRDLRENNRPSLQLVFAVPLKRPLAEGEDHDPDLEDPDGPHLVDIDVDLGTPARDLLGAVTHFTEVAWPGRTDHIKLRDTLVKDESVAPFLYYDKA